ncbi:hypothetical protein Dsin_014182 [Dipteronia sinensis]|uniref:Uncharacterized protein n=1 Tax=Dipteronia sinensis TaxID=43782 RepID=A0AAE0AMH6_9ROSI|nr:hypothetical protein Dsin_014182 [Dipteronia sinensis]
MSGTSEVRHNVSADDSDNATMWVIPGADSYSFGIGRSSTLVAEENTSMIYKGQFFPTKKDLKRLVGFFCNTAELQMKETFQQLPSFGYVLEQQNPGTITDLQCADDGKFMYFFMALEASLRGFQRFMRHVIAVYGTHLKGRFGGTMFVATAQY